MSWAEAIPGPELAIQLARVEWSSLSDCELVDAMDAARRQATWAQALMLEGVAELVRRRKHDDPVPGSERHRRICGEVSLELTVSTTQAEELVFLADAMPDRLPATWAALRTGRIDYHRARAIADGLAVLDDELACQLEAELARAAVDDTTTLLRRRISRAVKKADPDAAVQRTTRSRAERRVELWDNHDDTCDLVGRHLDSTDAHAVHNRLTAAAQAMKADGDQRPIDHIRLDLYRDLLRGVPLPEATHHLVTTPPAAEDADRLDDAAATGHPAPPDHDAPAEPPGTPGAAAHPMAAHPTGRLVDQMERQLAHTLAEAADERLTSIFERARAEGRLDGMARLIGEAVDAMRDALDPLVDSWCRATNDVPTSMRGKGAAAASATGNRAAGRQRARPAHRPAQADRRAHGRDRRRAERHGHPGYRPPVALQRLIQRRHSTCVFPTCHRKAVHCDIDHTTPYDKGGRTCKCNTAPLCRAHHRIFKQHQQWKLVQLWPGLLIWVAPAGTWHIVLPE
ncbi:MAG TPA: DUF222 domain-containing protein [Streptosporangiaceae bacterium]